MDPGELRNLKEFLLLYNKISEDCFKKCIFDMTTRGLDTEEGGCIATCTQKHINVNHKTMELFAEINPPFQQRKATEREEEFRKIQEDAKNAALSEQKPPWYASIFGIGGSKNSLPPAMADTAMLDTTALGTNSTATSS